MGNSIGRFLKLRDACSDKMEYVDKSEISNIWPYDTGSELIMKNGKSTWVKEAPEQILQMLEESKETNPWEHHK